MTCLHKDFLFSSFSFYRFVINNNRSTLLALFVGPKGNDIRYCFSKYMSTKNVHGSLFAYGKMSKLKICPVSRALSTHTVFSGVGGKTITKGVFWI